MTTVVSLINMKGGVGKTTIASQLALEADYMGWQTLAVDLDPQANLSQALLGQYEYYRCLRQGDLETSIDRILRGYSPPSKRRASPSAVDVHDAILRNVGPGNSRLDLLPSKLELSWTIKRSQVDPQNLAKALASLSDEYRLILIDCAPTESILTEAAYYASRYLLVPVKPEYLATIGLPLLQRSLQEFKEQNRDQEIDVAGVVFNNSTYPSQTDRGADQSKREVKQIASEHKWRVFRHEIPYSKSWPKAARDGTPIGRTSHARRKVANAFLEFSSEFFQAIGLR